MLKKAKQNEVASDILPGSSSVKVAIVDAQTGEKLVALNEPEKEMEIIAVHADWAEQDSDRY